MSNNQQPNNYSQSVRNQQLFTKILCLAIEITILCSSRILQNYNPPPLFYVYKNIQSIGYGFMMVSLLLIIFLKKSGNSYKRRIIISNQALMIIGLIQILFGDIIAVEHIYVQSYNVSISLFVIQFLLFIQATSFQYILWPNLPVIIRPD